MQIRLTEAEVKLALAISIFTKTGLRISSEEFDFSVGTKNGEQFTISEAIIDIKEE